MIKTALIAAALATASISAHASEATDLIGRFYADVDNTAKSVGDLDAYYAETFQDHDRNPTAPAELSDKQVILGLFTELRAGFPDGKHVLDIVEDAGEGRAMVYWTFSGTHTGPFYGMPASGNAVSINGVDIFKVSDGQFAEQRHVEELLGMFEQMKPRQ